MSEDYKLMRNNRKSFINADHTRNSFGRFGDDFCELILSYLCFEEKIRLEGLNRQWSRCIYNKVFEMEYPLSRKYSRSFNEKKRLFTSKKLIKKCHFIKKLKLSMACDNEILEMVSNNCRFLERIDMRFDQNETFRREILNAFSQNCGPRIKCIKILKSSDESFNSEPVISLLIDYSEYFSNLREIKLSIDSDKCWKCFVQFVAIFAKRIKSLCLRIKFNDNYRNIEETFGHISRFININNIDLKIESENRLELKLAEEVKLLAKNCLYLKSIALEIKGDISCYGIIIKSFESLSNLTSLKLNIKSDAIELGSIEVLRRFKNLTELHLLYANLSDDSFTNIHLYCPKLKSIQLTALRSITDLTLHSLSRIEPLQHITITEIPECAHKITDSGVCDILNNCRNIKVINLNCGISITHLTFTTLNILAEKSHPRKIKFLYLWSRPSISIDEIWPEINNMPENLIIKGGKYFYGCGTRVMRAMYSYRRELGCSQ